MDIKERYRKHKEKHYKKLEKNLLATIDEDLEFEFELQDKSKKEFLKEKKSEIKERKRMLKAFLNKQFSPKYKTDHSTQYDCVINRKRLNIDIAKTCRKSKKAKVEISMILMFEDNGKEYKYLGSVEATSNSNKSIDAKTNQSLFKEAIRKYPTASGMITVHNHPSVANAIPSAGDDRASLVQYLAGKALGIELLDDCIMSELDFYSRRQAECNNETHSLFKKQKYSEDTLNKILDENKYIAYLMSTKTMPIDY